MAYDSARDRVVLFGGTTGRVGKVPMLADTWEWDGRRWQILTDPYANPNRNHFVLHYDLERKRVFAFGGLDRRHDATDSMLVLHGNRFHPWEGERPSARFNHAMVRLPAGRAFLFGGCTQPGESYVPLGDAWQWEGEAWRRLDREP